VFLKVELKKAGVTYADLVARMKKTRLQGRNGSLGDEQAEAGHVQRDVVSGRTSCNRCGGRQTGGYLDGGGDLG
jgi:hypothetical protein